MLDISGAGCLRCRVGQCVAYASHMSEDINQQILVEVRRLKRAFYLVLALVALLSVPSFYAGFKRASVRADSWEQVTALMRRQDFPAALSMAQGLVARQPDYYYGHAYLGAIYLAIGDTTNAEKHYARAYELFPNEESEKDLAAVRKRTGSQGSFKLLTR